MDHFRYGRFRFGKVVFLFAHIIESSDLWKTAHKKGKDLRKIVTL